MEYVCNNKDKCTGCSACAQICPKSAISMNVNDEGFLYPQINDSLCVDCGLCHSVCQAELEVSANKLANNIFLCYSKDDFVRKKSSSGGIFYEIAKSVITDGGYVCSAKYNGDFEVIHVVASSLEELNAMLKSKYIQSNIGDTYKIIEELLSNDKKVLFVGTPCQVKGLKMFLKKDYKNLLCGEVVCHGVPSNKVFKKYIDYVHKNSKLKSIDFRDKTTGWKDYTIKFEFEDGYIFQEKRNKCLYFMGFIDNLYLRKSCYRCDCKLENSFADFTLGDCWGIEKIAPQNDDDKGVSLLIINTEKANWLKNSLNDIYIEEIDSEEFLKYNPSISVSESYNDKRKIFFDNFNKYDFGTLWDYVYTDSKLKRLKISMLNKVK